MRNYRILIIGILFILLWHNISEGGTDIGQEKIERNGIVVYQPNSLDRKILAIISKANMQILENYAYWLQENIEYVGDEGDYWQSPEETLERGAGDCEDFAFLNDAFLRLLGYNSRTMVLFNNDGSRHAICIFMDGDYYSFFSNMVLKRTQARTMEELVDYFCARGTKRMYEIRLGEE